MPVRPPRICNCGLRIASGERCPCERRRKAEADRERPNARARGYDSSWEQIRGRFLKAHPTCCVCGEPATDVDHVQSVRDRPDLRLSWSNLRSLCHSHHSQRTARDHGFARPKGIA